MSGVEWQRWMVGIPRVWDRRGAAACLVAGLLLGGSALAQQQPADGEHLPTDDPTPPSLPAGAVRLVNFARYDNRVAICAEEPGPPVEQGVRLVPHTRVWVHDGHKLRQVATAPGTCDPAWSPNGERVAVAAPDGLWVLSSDLSATMHLVDTRHSETPANEFEHRTLSQPQWAPDASGLAFLVSTGATSWVEVVSVRTGQTIYTSEPETYEFAWGVDSRSLRFGSRVVRFTLD